jgi:acyl carrier protein
MSAYLYLGVKVSDNHKKLVDVFITSLQLNANEFSEALQYNTIKQWDSTGHMALIVGLEREFDVMLDMDDIIDMSSFAKSKDILSNYGVEF